MPYLEPYLKFELGSGSPGVVGGGGGFLVGKGNGEGGCVANPWKKVNRVVIMMEEIIMMFRLCLGLMGRGLAVEVGKEMRDSDSVSESGETSSNSSSSKAI